MKLCTLMDLGDIMHISRDPKLLKQYLTFKALVYVNSDYTALSIYNQINEHSLEAHVESLPDVRGYKLKRFLIDSGIDAFKESGEDVLSVLNFVNKDDKALLLFSGTFAERVGTINDKVLFVTERERYL